MRLLTEDVRPAVLPEDREVVIDTTNGTITLPLDRYFLTEGEQAEVLHASALAMHECAADRGYVFTDPRSGWREPVEGALPTGDRRFGVWWMPGAETYGYGTGRPHPPPTGPPWPSAHEPTSSVKSSSECGQTPTVQQFWPGTELSEPVPDFVKLARESSAGQAVLDDWEACLGTHGLQRNEERPLGHHRRQAQLGGTRVEYGEPLGPDSAVLDARCKADVDLVDRLTQIVADLQAPFIAAHRSELTALRVALDDSLHVHGPT